MENFLDYAIINIESLNFIDFTEIEETSENTIRKSLDKSQFIIKYNIEPSFIKNGTVVPLQFLNYTESLELMRSEKWQETPEE